MASEKGKPGMNASQVSRKVGSWDIQQRIPAGDGPYPLLLLLHGWTGDENSMWIFTSRLSNNFITVAPRGPFSTPRGGFGWYPQGKRAWPSLDDFKPAVEALLELISSKNFSNADLSQVNMVGFSQGAALMYSMALYHSPKVGTLAGLSGFLPEGTSGLVERRPLLGKQVFVAHGRMDELVPVNRARLAVAILEQAGARVTYCEENVGHKLSANCFRGMGEFFKEHMPKVFDHK
jgi:phospholipase/carboxylesterase